MNEKQARRLIEKRSIDYVPFSERHGKAWHLWPVLFSGNANLATVATGVVGVVLGGNLFWTTVAVVLGCALGTFFMAFHAPQGAQLGLPQIIQSRPQFGYMGALMVWGVAVIAYIGFNSVDQILAAQTVRSVYAVPTGVIVIVFAPLALGFAMFGYAIIHIMQRWMAYVMIATLVIFSTFSLRLHLPAQQLQFGFSRLHAVPFLSQFFAAAAYQLSWSIYVSDYSRYLPKSVSMRASFWWTYAGAFVSGAWMMSVGALTVALYPTLDVATALRATANSLFPGFGSLVLLVSMLGLLTVTSLNFYSSSLTLLSIANSIRTSHHSVSRRMLAMIISAVLATSLAISASTSFMAEFRNFLGILLYLLTPWTAINLIDFYVVRKGHYSIREIFNRHGMYERWNWRGLTAYAVAFLAMVPFFSTGIYTGPIARTLGGADISMLIGLPVAAATYLLCCRSLNLEEDRLRAHTADIGLDADGPQYLHVGVALEPAQAREGEGFFL